MLRQFIRLKFVLFDPPRATVLIDFDAPGDGVEPGQQWLPRPEGSARLMNAQPEFLQQVLGLSAVSNLSQKELKQLWTQAVNQRGGGIGVGLLITEHKSFPLACAPRRRGHSFSRHGHIP